ncbi:MAG: bi-functional transferase/deacetylase [Candidatus Saccharibacteria bacterium]|nr:bi-functional transferase/deacetylase [Candidatus Saccharibacteria bacterium]
MARKARVIALVPAHNEQDIIKATIVSLMAQTYPFSYVLIIADNCTDNTVRIVKRCQRKYGSDKLRLLITTGNAYKKAGALNQGFKAVRKSRPDFVFGMDADTIIDQHMVEEAVKQFRYEAHTAGICSAYRTMPLKDDVTLWQRFLWRLQNIEFGLANAWRVENYRSARVLPGVSVMFRAQALRDVYKLNNGIVWATDSLVEDYRLTLELKDLGWDTKSSLRMISWSDVPLRLFGKGGLFDQRQRWYSGTVDELRRRGVKKHSRYELFTIALLAINFLMRLLLIAAYATIIAMGNNVQWISFFLLIPVVAALVQFHRWVKYTDQRDRWQGFMTLMLVPNEAYAIFREFIYLYAIWLSYRRPNRAW